MAVFQSVKAEQHDAKAQEAVCAYGRLIPGTNWLITAVMDSRAIYAPLRRTAWQVVGLHASVFCWLPRDCVIPSRISGRSE